MNAGQTTLTVITALAAIAAAALSWWAGHQSTGQREHQARREEWWRRFQWATDLAMSAVDGKVRVGLALLTVLGHSPLATTDELDAISAVNAEVFEVLTSPPPEREHDEVGSTEAGKREDIDDQADATDPANGCPPADPA